MSALRIGSLFSGVGGLDLAVEEFFDAETVWHCEFDENPSKVLAARWPGVPNLGDITKVDWSTVEPVDIVCGGSPCQDVSAAGPRTGMTEGTRSNLWVQMREAIAYLKPSIVIWENVRGALSAYAFSSVESDPGLLGEYGPDRPALRAVGRVVGDLSALGYDAIWATVPASDVGAPHRRERVFVLAYTQDIGHERGWPTRDRGTGPSDGGRRADGPLKLLPTTKLMPTPTASDASGSGGSTPSDVTLTDLVERTEFGTRANARHLLPTPTVTNTHGNDVNSRGEMLLPGVAVEVQENGQNWAEYTAAVGRWESLTRPAPAPTRADGKNGRHRLSPLLPEWMMGYPLGWVTDILEREPAIKACGNGVVPPQAYYALSIMWPRVVAHIQEVAA